MLEHTTGRGLDEKEILRYIDLVSRRTEILVNSGIGWKPEYEKELDSIDKELAQLRPLVDAEHETRRKRGR